jgi:gamma-glutamyltranspeptidase / glutathione hydrolase
VLTGRPTTWATHGVVATPHYLASQAGLRVLQDGGNAVEAAIAANAVLHVVYPHNCHIGGDLFAIVWDPRDQSLRGLNASGPAVTGATVERLRSLGLTAMPERGPHPITVPGTVAGWFALLEKYGSGKREIGALLAPATSYASEGAPLSPKLARYLEDCRPWLSQDPGARDLFFSGPPLRAADLLRQPALAETFGRVARDGRDGFYDGAVADDIVTTLNGLGSQITHDDLASFEPEWVTPLRTPYRHLELVEMPPNTVGPASLLMANIVEGWPVAEWGHTTGAGVHAWVETTKRAFAERDRYIADSRVVDVPLERFVEKSVAASHRAAIDLERVSPEPVVVTSDGDTIYLCVVDQDGLAISFIQSLFMGFGSGVVAPKSGVLFHNRGQGFSLDPDDANVVQPGKRPRHTLIPAMLLRDGVPEVVIGTMGGDAQSQIHLQLLMGLVDFGLDPQQAIEVPRWRHYGQPDGHALLLVEPGVGEETIGDLRRRGHDVTVTAEWFEGMGHSQMIAIDRQRGVLGGAADPRGDGIAAGW